MEQVLKPLLSGSKKIHPLSSRPEEMYVTESKREFKSYDNRDDHLRDLRNKEDVTKTRRLLETYNALSL